MITKRFAASASLKEGGENQAGKKGEKTFGIQKTRREVLATQHKADLFPHPSCLGGGGQEGLRGEKRDLEKWSLNTGGRDVTQEDSLRTRRRIQRSLQRGTSAGTESLA